MIVLREGTEAEFAIAPELGAWLLRYGRNVAGRGWVEAIRFDPAVVDRYPLQMYAGNPLLFPLVSYNVAGGKEHFYEWGGVTYPLPQHGFARRTPWQVISQTGVSVTMELVDNEATRAVYPFQFSHRVTYRLEQGRLWFEQRIENRSADTMPFGVGIHPYFNVPLSPQSQRDTCFVRLPAARCAQAAPQMASFTMRDQPAQDLPVAQDVADTILLTGLARREVALVDPQAGVQVLLNWEDAPRYRSVALWSKSTDAPFYCIEPWTSLPNAFGRPQDHDLILLAPSEVFEARLWFDIQPL